MVCIPMANRESPGARIERLLEEGDDRGALNAANELLKQSPSSFLANIGRARASMRLKNFIDSEFYCNEALRLAPNHEDARIMRASLDMRLGKTDAALDNLRFVIGLRGKQHVEAKITLLLTLHSAERFEEFEREASTPGDWRKDARSELIGARLAVLKDRQKGLAELIALFNSRHEPILRRFAGFEAVGILDKDKRYREAFDLVQQVHAATTGQLDYDIWFTPLETQLRQLDRVPRIWTPRAPKVDGVAFIAAMPRSGTTLLETMLDRHPSIGGIGEFDGIDHVCRTLFDGGKWPVRGSAIPDQVFTDLQRGYLEGAAQIRKPGAHWTFDKSLRSWRAVPEIFTVFPGSVCINVERDPRDMATSIMLSYFNPASFEWTRELNAIRMMAQYARKLVPKAFDVLEVPNVRIVYEDLVEEPGIYAKQCLDLMGLPMDDRVLSPEQSTKAAFTLSQAQVRRPINKKSIGRWKNYEWAFDSRWDEVCAAHEARRKHR